MKVTIIIEPKAQGAEPKQRHVSVESDVAIDELVNKFRRLLMKTRDEDRRARRAEVPI